MIRINGKETGAKMLSGFNVNAAGLISATNDKGWVYDWIRRAKPTSMLFMRDGQDLEMSHIAYEIMKEYMDEPLVISRPFWVNGSGDGSTWQRMGGAEAAKWMKANQKHRGRIYMYEHNEPLVQGRRDIEAYTRFMKEYITEGLNLGMKLCVSNIGHSTMPDEDIQNGYWDEYMVFISDTQEALRKDGAELNLVHGAHAYSIETAFGLGHYAGGKATTLEGLLDPKYFKPENWASQEDLSIWGGTWHILREMRWQDRLKKMGKAPIKIIYTECWWDKMGDITESSRYFTVNGQSRHIYDHWGALYGTNNYPEVRGPMTMKGAFEALSGKPWEQFFVDELNHIEPLVYQNGVIGGNMFTASYDEPWNNKGGYNFLREKSLSEYIADNVQWSVDDAPVEEPDDPIVVQPVWQRAQVALSPSGTINVHKIRDNSTPIEATIRVSDYFWINVEETVKYSPWIRIRTFDGLTGWTDENILYSIVSEEDWPDVPVEDKNNKELLEKAQLRVELARDITDEMWDVLTSKLESIEQKLKAL